MAAQAPFCFVEEKRKPGRNLYREDIPQEDEEDRQHPGRQQKGGMSPEKLHHLPGLAPQNGNRMPDQTENAERKSHDPEKVIPRRKEPIPVKERMGRAQNPAASAFVAAMF